MSLKRSSEFKKLWLNGIVILQKKLMEVKKWYRRVSNKLKPFFVPKYCLIYVISFGIGFYLFGPIDGIEKIKSLKIPSLNANKEINTLDTLQRELDDLKKTLQAMKDKETKKRPIFVPNNFGEPIIGEIVTGFEWVYQDNSWRLHPGLAIETQPNNSVVAIADGEVSEVKETPEHEFTIKIDHGNGWESIYSNLAQVTVQEKQALNKGLIVGFINKNTNGAKPILYFAIYHNGQPVDPAKFIKGLPRKQNLNQ